MNRVKPMRNTIRENAPCKGCAERFTACSDHCPLDARGEFGYKAWMDKRREVDSARKAYNDLNRRKNWHRKDFGRW